MDVEQTPIADCWTIETYLFSDNRGRFARFFCRKELDAILRGNKIQQINYSFTKKKGSIRGMHFQHSPAAEEKLVRCFRGEVYDVVVDLRKGSPTFLKWHSEILSENNMKMLFIPKGCAHGFQSLENDCELLYLHTEFYTPSCEGGVSYNDPRINISWPLGVSEISDKDANYKYLPPSFNGLRL